MNKAVIQVGGTQYLVEEGDKIVASRQVKADVKVLGLIGDKAVKAGSKDLKGVKVILEKIEDFMGPKIKVARYRAKSRYQKNKSHRQPFSSYLVKSITEAKEKKAVEAEKE